MNSPSSGSPSHRRFARPAGAFALGVLLALSTAAPAAAQGTQSKGSPSSGLIAGGAIVALVLLSAVFLRTRWARQRQALQPRPLALMPSPDPGQHCRTTEAGGWFLLAGWSEKVAGAGRDADPTLLVNADDGVGLISVYDGGAGADATTARLARATTEAWFHQIATDTDEGNINDELQRRLAPPRRMAPTTIAAVAFVALDGTLVAAEALWAGNSRCYVLEAQEGLRALTTDDSDEHDALALLRTRAPVTNLVRAKRPFRINRHVVDITTPFLLVAATDGCFSWLQTPAHFEHVLLSTLVAADDLDDWAKRLLSTLAGSADDDASFAIASLGFDSFADLKQSLTSRAESVAHDHWAPFTTADAEDAATMESLRTSSWERYQPGYESLIAARVHTT